MIKRDYGCYLIFIMEIILGSIGGATLIVAGLANFLGKIWTERITQQVIAKYQLSLETFKSQNEIALEQFRRRADAELKDVDIFSGISQKVYQEFFKRRIEAYLKLLEIKNKYLEDMHEDFIIQETHRSGEVYVSIYKQLRKVLLVEQLYISSELDQTFQELRAEAAKYIREVDMIEAYAHPKELPDAIAEQQWRVIPTTNSGHFEKRVFSSEERYLHEHEIDRQQRQLYPA